MSEPIISVSGLRGIIGESLSPELVARYLGAFASGLPRGKVVLSYDGRATGPMLCDVARAALVATGHTVLDAGPQATPGPGSLPARDADVFYVQIGVRLRGALSLAP